MENAYFDEKLIFQTAEGNAAAFRKLYDATKSAVYGFALSILKNRHDAEEAMQDAYVRLYRGAPSYKSENRPMSWVLKITQNVCYDMLRDKNRAKIVDISDYTDLIRSEESGIVAAENRLLLDTALRVLNDEERQCVLLHAACGLKHREVAELLGIPLSSVTTMYSRALQKLRKEIERKEASDGTA